VKYRVEIDLSFDSKEDAQACLDYIEAIKAKAVSIEPSVATSPTLSMPKKARMYECRHDEGKPCSNYENVDFKAVEVKPWSPTAVAAAAEAKAIADAEAAKGATGATGGKA
jgi:hypothetical protein